MKRLGLGVFGAAVLLWCSGHALAQDSMGGLKGLPGAVKNDAANAAQQEIQGTTGKLLGTGKDAAAPPANAAGNAADDAAKGANPAPAAPAAPADDSDEAQ